MAGVLLLAAKNKKAEKDITYCKDFLQKKVYDTLSSSFKKVEFISTPNRFFFYLVKMNNKNITLMLKATGWLMKEPYLP